MARKRYSKGKRVDMRQGGRVNLKKGGGSPQPKRHKDPSKKEPFKQSQVSPTPNVGQPPPEVPLITRVPFVLIPTSHTFSSSQCSFIESPL